MIAYFTQDVGGMPLWQAIGWFAIIGISFGYIIGSNC